MSGQTQHTDQLKRELGFTETFSVVVNRIIGSGIFRTPAAVMLVTGSLSIFYGAWIVGGIATLLGALCYAELVAMMPKSGGPYVFLKAAYPPYVTFLRGWAMFFVSETGAIAAVSLFFAETLINLLQLPQSNAFQAIISILLVFVITFINGFGIKLSGRLQNVFSFAKIAVLLLVVAFSFSKGLVSGHFTNEGPSVWTWAGFISVFTALRYTFFAYSGWEGATYIAEEVKNPQRNLPLSLFAGIGVVVILYLLMNTAYVNVLGAARLAGSTVVAADAMEVSLGIAGTLLVGVAILMSTFGNVNTQVLVKSRTWFAMARDRLFFTGLAKVHPKYQTPNRAMIAQGLWAVVLILFAVSAKNAYETIIDFFSFVSSVFNVLTFLSLYILRKRHPEWPRPYKAWAYPFSLILVLAIQVTFMVVTLYTAFLPSLFGILLTASGLLYYRYALPKDLT